MASRRVDRLFVSFDPTTEEVIAEVINATPNEVNQAVTAAKRAFPKWQALETQIRKEYLIRLKEALIKQQEVLAYTIQLELGSAFEFTRSVQVGGPIQELTSLLEAFDSYSFEEISENATIIKEGFGVVATLAEEGLERTEQLVAELAGKNDPIK